MSPFIPGATIRVEACHATGQIKKYWETTVVRDDGGYLVLRAPAGSALYGPSGEVLWTPRHEVDYHFWEGM